MSIPELKKIVGKERVLDTPEVLEKYTADESFASPERPVCVVQPRNIDELKRIVQWANQKGAPLVPVSSGEPHFRGDTVPGVKRAVIVDLRSMNRIIRINASNRVALVEPGVTFDHLQAELAREGLSAYLPLMPRSGKSVLTSALEKDPITMPCVHFDSTDPMLCAEIVFGTGDSMRTGEAAGPDPLEKQWEIGKAQISPFGPTQMDPQRLVQGAQGTIGVVTWISVKCRFLSENSRAFFVAGPTLEPLIELSYKLTKIRFTGNIFILNGLNCACLLRRSPEEITGTAGAAPEWMLFVSCEGYGPLSREKVDYLEADLREIADSLNLKIETSVGGMEAEELAGLLASSSPEPYWKQRLKKGCAEVLFLTTQGRIPVFTRLLSEVLHQYGYPPENIGAYIQPVVMGTSCHCEFDFYYNPDDPIEAEKTKEIVMAVADKMEAGGAFFSRPFKPWSEIAYRRSSDTIEMQKKVKQIFDPNGILNPGHLCFQ